MKIFFRVVPGHSSVPVWPEGWPVPRVGDTVVDDDRGQREVTAVVWYPQGEDSIEPFVYVVLH